MCVTVFSPLKKGRDEFENYQFSTLGVFFPHMCYELPYFLSAIKNEEEKGKRKIYLNKNTLERKTFLFLNL